MIVQMSINNHIFKGGELKWLVVQVRKEVP